MTESAITLLHVVVDCNIEGLSDSFDPRMIKFQKCIVMAETTFLPKENDEIPSGMV